MSNLITVRNYFTFFNNLGQCLCDKLHISFVTSHALEAIAISVVPDFNRSVLAAEIYYLLLLLVYASYVI